MIAIITEKPSVGMDIARVVGATQRKKGYIEGGGYLVTWALGHLVQLALPSFYGHTRPTAENLPFIPDPFSLVVRQRKTDKGTVTDPAAAKQLTVIGEVLSRATAVIAATDAGREGELIFRHIYNHLGCVLPFKRLWISSLTDDAIRAGLDSMRDGAEYDKLHMAAECRAKADWLVGINASQALAVASGLNNNSLGRVQTPTLALICSRYKENRLFVPSHYWELYAVLQKGDALRKFRYTGELPDKEQAERLQARVTAAGEATVTLCETKPSRQSPPLLYDLTALQKDCNVRYDLSAEKTLEIAQTLYERKLITYPRTGSRYIPHDIFRTIPSLIGKAIAIPVFSHMKSNIDMAALPTVCVDDTKVTDHHALLITGVKAQDLSDQEQDIYTLIAGRMLETFSPDCQKETLTMEATADGEPFVSRSTVITFPGWRAAFRRHDQEDDSTAEGDGDAVFQNGEIAVIGGTSLATKKTRPQPLYTEASLLSAMENAGKDIEDKEAREAMRECGLGTPATRAAIIGTLLRREYITRNGKSLVPTEKGMFVYEAVKEMRIADPQLTGEWEKALAEIEAGNLPPDTFLSAIEVYTRQVTGELLTLNFLGSSSSSVPCPKCKKGHILMRNKVAKCDNTECGLLVFRRFLNKELSDQHLEQLFSSGKTKLIKGLKGKKGNPFDAKLTFDDSYNLTFVPTPSKSPKPKRGTIAKPNKKPAPKG